MRIKLIKPAIRAGTGLVLPNTAQLQDVALPLLAALTPDDHSVTIVDESFGPDDGDDAIDLVGISVLTDMALRSYQIADHYRSRGVTVVMGGIHPTMVPDEVAEHCDAVVLQEGDRAWGQLLRDAEDGHLRRFYQAEMMPRLEGLPIPRRDLYPKPVHWHPAPFSVGIEASRGCPYDCEFCSVLKTRGHTYRMRPVDEIIEEIQAIDCEHLVFVDDNMALDRRASRQLFAAMIPLKRRWVAEGNVALAEDPELLRLMKRAGCVGLLVGFETVKRGTMRTMKKLSRLKLDHAEAVRRFHGEGIAVMGAFVFGLDDDTPAVFDQTLEFAVNEKLDFAQFRELVPYPGTPLYERLESEGRLLDPKWWLDPNRDFRDATPTFRPRGMSPQELVDGLVLMSKEFYSFHSILKRFPGIAPRQRSGLGITLFFVINWVLSRRYRDSHGITVRNVTGLSEVALGAAPARLCDRDRRRGSRFGGGS